MTFSQSIFPLHNQIQYYPWGSTQLIPDLLEIDNPDNKPMAEVWMGAHPKASSYINIDNSQISLFEFIRQNTNIVLGSSAASKFGELPFLFKILAAKRPLSIQVHPSKLQAEAGYEKENSAKIPLDAPHRNYKDSNHKPELVYALTPYLAMNGFRTFSDVLTQFEKVNSSALCGELNKFSMSRDSQGLRDFFKTILELEGDKKHLALYELLEWATKSKDTVAKLIIDLSAQYPNDIGLFAPLLLNVVTLKPGEAMFLNAQTPHAYLNGMALEIMSNSDNVLRAGLTPKYIDVDELVSCSEFLPTENEDILTKAVKNGCESVFPVPVEDFRFAIYDTPVNYAVQLSGAEIWFAIDSDASFVTASNEEVTINRGESVFIPLYCRSIKITSQGKVARAYC